MLYYLVKAHRELWRLMLDGDDHKQELMADLIFTSERKRWFEKLSRSFEDMNDIKNDCFLCEYTFNVMGYCDCDDCPLTKMNNKCGSPISDYWDWCNSEHDEIDLRKELTAKILEWKPTRFNYGKYSW